MKYLLFILLLVAVVIAAGCTNTGSDTVQPTTTPAEITTSAVPTAAPTIPDTITQIPTGYSLSNHFSGNGDDVKSFTATGSGLKIFTLFHNGDRNFIVWLKDTSGDKVALLVNENGKYYDKKSETLSSGTYYLDITADGSWTIDISSM